MKIPQSPRPTDLLLRELTGANPSPEKLAALFQQGPLIKGKYRHWDQMRHLPPPDQLTAEEWWLGMKLARSKLHRNVPLYAKDGKPFVFAIPDPLERALHHISQQASGRLFSADQITNPATRDRYLISSLIDEAITSSQLEGAVTTMDVAKTMLRTGRPPRDRSEQMIFNTFLAMQHVRDLQDKPLTPEMILALHRIVTENTLDDPTKAGRFREARDQIVVQDATTGTIFHHPPPAAELEERLARLCRFANEEHGDAFFHPVVRAATIHFCIGYDHPFVDGNGRTARALFYWSMLRQGYWLVQYLSISRILKKAPSKYATAYLYTETDENDLTYFIDYQQQVIARSLVHLNEYLARKLEEVRTVESFVHEADRFNHRQIALLSHALRHPGAWYTFESHKRSHNVVYQTARTDLLGLQDMGLLQAVKRGKMHQFSAVSDLVPRLRALQGARR